MSKKTKPQKAEAEETETLSAQQAGEADASSENEKETTQLMKDLEELAKKLQEQNELLMRTAAEYDNFRKRTAKEKAEIRENCVAETILSLLPVVDSLDRAVSYGSEDPAAMEEGLRLIAKQMNEQLKSLHVEEIPTDAGFDPLFHEAVMHVEDENAAENQITEVFQKGYKIGDKVIRHSIVKVSN